MLTKIDKSKEESLVALLDRYPCQGTFFRSDLEYLGLESDAHCYLTVNSPLDELTFLILRYRDSVSVLGDGAIEVDDAEDFIGYVMANQIRWLSGPKSSITHLTGHLPPNVLELFDQQYLMEAVAVSRDVPKPKWEVQVTSESKLLQVYDFTQSEPTFAQFPPFKAFAGEFRSGMRRIFHVEIDGGIVGSASIIANNSKSGMIAAVTTDHRYRSKGIGSSLVASITDVLVKEGRVACLMQVHSPEGGLYGALGYRVIDQWLFCGTPEFLKQCQLR